MDQLSMFEMNETKIRLFEISEANGNHHENKNYYLHNDYIDAAKYFHIRTTDDIIIDMCLS